MATPFVILPFGYSTNKPDISRMSSIKLSNYFSSTVKSIENLELIRLPCHQFSFSTVITPVLLRQSYFWTHQKLSMATSRRNWLYQFIVPILSDYFYFTGICYSRQVIQIIFLSFHSLSLIVLSFSRCILPYIFLNNSTLIIKIN